MKSSSRRSEGRGRGEQERERRRRRSTHSAISCVPCYLLCCCVGLALRHRAPRPPPARPRAGMRCGSKVTLLSNKHHVHARAVRYAADPSSFAAWRRLLYQQAVLLRTFTTAGSGCLPRLSG